LLLALSIGRGENKIILYLFVITKVINFNSPLPTLPSKGGLTRKAIVHYSESVPISLSDLRPSLASDD